MTTLLAAIVVLGVLIFVHELGHFVAAKLMGVGVSRFSLGFPPRAFGFKRGETDYCVSWLPLGGYVKMVGERPDDEISEEEKARSFSHKPVWRRLLIVAAGPGFNVLFAVVAFYLGAAVFGLPDFATGVGAVKPASVAAKAGVKPGDKIIGIDGRPVKGWSEFVERIVTSRGRMVTLDVVRGGRTLSFRVKPEPRQVKDGRGRVRVYYTVGIRPDIPPVIGGTVPGLPAARAGLRPGDVILSVDGKAIGQFRELAHIIRNGRGRPLKFTFKRGGETRTLTVRPEMRNQPDARGKLRRIYFIGVSVAGPEVRIRLDPLEAVWYAVAETWSRGMLIIRSVGWLISGKVSVKELGGPLVIGRQAGQVARRGMVPLLLFAAFLSINLAILNLLPIPILDGGHILFFLIEAVRRKPISIKKREAAQQVGLVILLGLIVFVFYNDIIKLIVG